MYWDALLKEVLDKKKESKRLASHSPLSKSKKLENYPKKQIKKFFLGEANSNIYFTNREAEVMIKLLQGKTLSTAARRIKSLPTYHRILCQKYENEASMSNKIRTDWESVCK